MPCGVYKHPSQCGFQKGNKLWLLKKQKTGFRIGNKINLGRKHSVEFIQKRVDARKGYRHSEETKEKISKSHIGIRPNEETLKKLSISHLGINAKEKHPNWRGGISFEPYSTLFNQQLKDKIRVRDNFKCQMCGVPELELNSRLNIHHIDYNKKNSEENNLVSLCRKCHTKTNSNREKWMEYFTIGRMENERI